MRAAEVGVTLTEALQSVGPGWATLIHELYQVIEEEIAAAKRAGCTGHEEDESEPWCAACSPPRVLQVKEKFGGLRFYMTWETPRLEERIFQAGAASYRICEECGNPGQLRNSGWLRTLCDAHEEERRARQVRRGVGARREEPQP